MLNLTLEEVLRQRQALPAPDIQQKVLGGNSSKIDQATSRLIVFEGKEILLCKDDGV